MSFQLKHQLTHVIRQRQQRHVSEENSRCFDILLKALPLEEDDIVEDGGGGGGKVPPPPLSEESPGLQDSRNKNQVKVVTKSTTGNKGCGLNGKTQSAKSNVNKTVSSYVGVVTKRDTSPTTKLQDTKGSNIGTSSLQWKQSYSTEVTLVPNGAPVGNGEITRPSSASKIHTPVVGLRKQALVKAVPRTDLQQQMEAREKVSSLGHTTTVV